MNTVQLIGRLTRNPELRYTAAGTATCTIRLAVPRRKRNGEDPAPVYVDVVTFGPQAEAIAQYMAQGRRVAVAGRLEYREWTDNEGGRHSKHEVIAHEVDFLDKPRAAEDAAPDYGPDEEPF
jgi:single-strand DNA-binding protein